MEVLHVDLPGRSYNINIGLDILSDLGLFLKDFDLSGQVLLVTDRNVDAFYGKKVTAALNSAGFEVLKYVIEPGEGSKSLEMLSALWDFGLAGRLNRRSAVVALGGGVVGDLAGFAAATLLRGLPFFQVPTSLLAQVDSSVGGKVGINHQEGKNLLGAFYQPEAVFIDLQTLLTLEKKELSAGLAEIVKCGVIGDEDLFVFLEGLALADLLSCPGFAFKLVKQSCALKAAVVIEDERENGKRAILNFGHTVGHAIEKITGFRVYRHGEAVAIGMVVAASLAVNLRICEPVTRDRIKKVLTKFQLPVQVKQPVTDILKALAHDKKMLQGRLRLVLPRKIGEVDIYPAPPEKELARAIEECS